MIKLIFLPFSIVASYLGGAVSRRLFDLVWRAIDDQPPPEPETRNAPLGKLALSLALEGAVFRLTRGLIDHGARRGFAGLTGAWPGEEDEQEKQQE